MSVEKPVMPDEAAPASKIVAVDGTPLVPPSAPPMTQPAAEPPLAAPGAAVARPAPPELPQPKVVPKVKKGKYGAVTDHKQFVNYDDWAYECMERGYDGPHRIQGMNSFKFTRMHPKVGLQDAAIWNGRDDKGTIIAENAENKFIDTEDQIKS